MKSLSTLIFIVILFISSCNYRTPSDIRFERTTGIELSDSIIVLQDRFEESGPDYGLYYEFKLFDKDCKKIKRTVSKSKDWKEIEKGWEFHKTIDGIIYMISFSRTDCKIIYREELI